MFNIVKQKIKRLLGLSHNIASSEEIKLLSQEIQVLLKFKYREYIKHSPEQLPKFDEIGFKAYSQVEEDGILLYIFSLIGAANKKVVEICAGNGQECMAANLIINHGWQGYLFDGSENNVKSGQSFFANHKQTFLMPPTFNQAWFTAENVNQILLDSGANGEVDLLSLDIDGMDYWVWKAVECIQPRVCVFETHNVIPSHLSLTAKYDPDFYYLNQPIEHQDYRSASLLAMVNLSKSKGYRLIGSHRHGFNCFFMRNDIGQKYFPEVSVESCHDNPYTKLAQESRWNRVKSLDWQEV
ncbi:hypothetical protein H6F44_01835 [Pseudanabaena sp. FACHB-1277]|uniref:Methyltransferase FkbM domain-containing protein n=1 Tax=Pseudanabaena cinerea FACHB-1277 TaxID=2949581 RepID=A0A926URB5_9CYAN|nr:hypothetical protein [Pseudanabaena cinerea]MBD2148872.1 hypothetical protein [Pseudanabaena cinerea FACHB-1277]